MCSASVSAYFCEYMISFLTAPINHHVNRMVTLFPRHKLHGFKYGTQTSRTTTAASTAGCASRNIRGSKGSAFCNRMWSKGRYKKSTACVYAEACCLLNSFMYTYILLDAVRRSGNRVTEGETRPVRPLSVLMYKCESMTYKTFETSIPVPQDY